MRNTFTMDFCSYEKADSSDTVEWDFKGGVVAPVAELGHVAAVGFELRIPCSFSTRARQGKCHVPSNTMTSVSRRSLKTWLWGVSCQEL